MTNPYAAIAKAWQKGYDDGYREPKVHHPSPVTDELEPAYREGEQAGRDAHKPAETAHGITYLPVRSADFPSLIALRDARDFDSYLDAIGVNRQEPVVEEDGPGSQEREEPSEESSGSGAFELYDDAYSSDTEDDEAEGSRSGAYTPEPEEAVSSPDHEDVDSSEVEEQSR